MAHYFTNDYVKSDERKIKIKFNNKEYIMNTDNNVFSKKGLDFGTRTLLQSIDIPSLKGDILDFGCGYGVISIILAENKNIKIDGIDINLRSLRLAEKNALENRVQVNFFESNIYEKVTKKYDYIITNPPIRVGKEILYKILFEAKEHLKESGELIFVINKDQGAKSTIKALEKEYLVSVVAKNKGFYVVNCKIGKI